MRDTYLHLEHDGKLLLVDDDGKGPMRPTKGKLISKNKTGWDIRLPTQIETQNLGIKWIEKRRNIVILEMGEFEVVYATPLIEWPEKWAWKDNIISDSTVHPLARESVYRTLHRLVSKVIIPNKRGDILMAKVKRGFFTGMWTLPGGYIDYGEHPLKGARREVFEELGIDIEICDGKNVIEQKIFTDEGINFVSFTYLAKELDESTNFKLKHDEIEEVSWFSKDDAISQVASWFDLDAINKLS